MPEITRTTTAPTVALLFALAIAAAPAAHADSDADYLATLARHGVTGDRGALIGAAHDTCDAMGQGYVGSGSVLGFPADQLRTETTQTS